MGAAEPGSDRERLLYVYGFVPVAFVPLAPDPPWLAAAGVDLVAQGQFAALVEAVPTAEFGPEVIEQSLLSPEWTARVARRHAAVLQSALRGGVVIPARFCTLFSGPEAVTGALVANEGRLRRTLDRLAGRKEWGLRVRVDEAVLEAAIESSGAAGTSGDGEATTPGEAYLRDKQQAARVHEAVVGCMEAVAGEVVDCLGPAAHGLVLRPLPEDVATDEGGTAVLNLAALVDDAGEGRFRDAVGAVAERFLEQGFAFEVNGPWPAHSFVGDAEEDGGTGEASGTGTGDAARSAAARRGDTP